MGKIPTFYCLIKMHKPVACGRPILASAGLPFKILSAFVGWHLNSLLYQHSFLARHLIVDSRRVVRDLEGKVLPVPEFGYLGL